jgi:hypothetical protein
VSLPRFVASRIVRRTRGSSSPVVVQTAAGTFLTKLRGAAQGVPPLIAEIIVAELATVLSLPVPERALVVLDEGTPSDDRNDELADLLARSRGENLGFRFLPGAVDLRKTELERVDADVASRILWLDGLVQNHDRTTDNPNLLLWQGQIWLIDHGASLPFHYAWRKITEQEPREASFDPSRHALFSRAARLAEADADCASLLDRGALVAAASAVPESFLDAAFPEDEPRRIRAAYVAFLWKRLRAPRPFVPSPAT